MQILTSFGNLGVGLFIGLSAYFLVDQGFKTYRITHILYQLHSYAWLIGGIILALSFSIPYIDEVLTKELAYRALFPLGLENWYVTGHILLLLAHPHLNYVISKLSKRGHLSLISIWFIVWTIFPLLYVTMPFYSKYLLFLYIYFIVAYLKKYVRLTQRTSIKLVVLGLLGNVLAPIWFGVFSYLRSDFASMGRYLGHTYDLPNLLLVIGVLGIAINRKAQSKPIINKVATTTLAVYLIHENPFIRGMLWSKIDNAQVSNPILLVMYGLLVSLVIFIICVLIDLVKQATIDRLVQPYLLKLDGRFKKLQDRLD